MTDPTTGQRIVRALVDHGTETVFGIPGAHIYDFNDALHEAGDRIRFITTRHEQGAAFMAFGYAQATGRPGVFAVVPGPGMLNASAALSTALGANAPVLCITGNIMSHLIGRGRGQLHELPDQLATLRGLTKWAARIEHPAAAPGILKEAFSRLSEGRPGPVAVETPWDVMGQRAPFQQRHAAVAEPEANPVPTADEVMGAAELIRQARRPLIMVGGGARHAGSEVRALAERLQAPVTAHRSGKGIVDERSPFGMSLAAAFRYWPEVDLLLGIGSRLELQHFRWNWFPPGLRTVRIDIDPLERHRVPSDMMLTADARTGCSLLLAALDDAPARDPLTDAFARHKTQAAADIRAVQPQMSYLDAIRRALPADGFFVEEICQAGFTARFGFPVPQPRLYVTCGYQETLGFGFPTALGVKVAHPDRAVVSINGDGGFMFGVQELATAVQHGIAVVAVVFNNAAYGNVLRDQTQRYGGRLLGAQLTNPDFVGLAESFGAHGVRATSPAALESALRQAFQRTAPTVIEVPVEQGSETSPWTFLHPAPPQGTYQTGEDQARS